MENCWFFPRFFIFPAVNLYSFVDAVLFHLAAFMEEEKKIFLRFVLIALRRTRAKFFVSHILKTSFSEKGERQKLIIAFWEEHR